MDVLDPWVLTPCPGARRDELVTLLESLGLPDNVVVVTTDRDPVTPDARWPIVKLVPWDGWHISAWWNAGLDAIREIVALDYDEATWDVLCVGSDATGKPDSLELLGAEMRRLGVSMAGPSWHGLARPGQPTVFRCDDARTVHHRVQGACFMLPGEENLRCDEAYRWWYTEDDLEMQARCRNGSALVADTGLIHMTDHALDEERFTYAAEDRARYVAHWGREPW